ncbi:aldo/keto reductase [Saccharopolyspora sp. HNM0983]|uniref:Aldo/keto reductase n=1 Tax=Saccharopolyspora montiporae TaxID=2781240 RepID=A0A929G1S0_9PSEU|nr:aldo/keto reductase [Saccharopolyspora sp. HNM0983]MBE9376569.1 aldo/keto reductase [Saccharopolyspora sp. HNM0983]
MRSTILGKTGMDVSRIAFGTWQVGGDWGSYDEQAATGAIRHARELGVNLFDTAQGYGFGEAEALLGRALRQELDRDRESLVIATKGGIAPGAARSRDAGRSSLRSGVEQSLRALGVDHVDLYQVHWPDPRTPSEETAGALQELVDEGKIRHAGVSNYDAAQLADFDRTRPVETLQPPYHLFRRGIEAEILPYARTHDIGVLCYSPLASGLLTGTITPETRFESGDWRAQSTAFRGEALRRNLEIVDRLEEFAAGKRISVSQLAIAWVLAQQGVHAAIVGARSARNIENSIAAAEIDLTEEDLANIERITADAVEIGGASPEGVA